MQERFLDYARNDDTRVPLISQPAGIAPFRHPERSKMPFVREVVFRKLGTEPKDLGKAATTILKFESRYE